MDGVIILQISQRWVTVDPLLNDLEFTFDESKVDEVYEALITKLETGDGVLKSVYLTLREATKKWSCFI